MATVTGLTADRMEAIEAASVVDGYMDGSGHLILVRYDNSEIDAGYMLASVPDATETVKGVVELATTTEASTGTDTSRAVTPAGLAAAVSPLLPDATTTVKGKVELATVAEAEAGTDTTRAITAQGLAAALAILAAAVPSLVPTASETVQGKVELATTAEVITGTDTARAVTPAGVKAYTDSLIPHIDPDSDNSSGTTTSTIFTSTLSGATAASTIFVAPKSGSILVVNDVQLQNTGANNTWCSFAIREGSTIGSGTVFLGSDNSRSILNSIATALAFSRVIPVTGLTPGATYNIEQQFRVTAGTGTFANKHIAVIPIS